jgi:SAM-dependent methyltransferase
MSGPNRRPTSHERRTGEPWDASYADGPAPWDVDGPQPAFVRLVDEISLAGPVLDVGCGTGENALHVAARGLPVLGVDVAERAVAMARTKATERGIPAEFRVVDALDPAQLAPLTPSHGFATVLDCGLFHTFDDDERRTYVASLASATSVGATLHLLCFSDAGPDTGPHPVTKDEIRAFFGPGTGWEVVSVEPDRVRTIYHDEHGAPAWLATARRV